MKKTKIVRKKVEIVDDLICNLCGKSLKTYSTTDKEVFDFEGLIEIKMDCGYMSKNDGKIFTFSLCEDCVLKLMKKFKIKAKETYYF